MEMKLYFLFLLIFAFFDRGTIMTIFEKKNHRYFQFLSHFSVNHLTPPSFSMHSLVRLQ